MDLKTINLRIILNYFIRDRRSCIYIVFTYVAMLLGFSNNRFCGIDRSQWSIWLIDQYDWSILRKWLLLNYIACKHGYCMSSSMNRLCFLRPFLLNWPCIFSKKEYFRSVIIALVSLVFVQAWIVSWYSCKSFFLQYNLSSYLVL